MTTPASALSDNRRLTPSIEQAIEVLTEAGYVVFLPPPCKRTGGHGRHTLMTRSATCPGVEPIPHGYHSGRMGSFGFIVHCLCGDSFRDDLDEGPHSWKGHQALTGGSTPNPPDATAQSANKEQARTSGESS